MLVWGLGTRFTKDDTKDAPAIGFTPNNLNQYLFSAFAQDQFALGSLGMMTVGTKVEHNDYTGFEIEPNLRLQRQLGANRMVWTAVSRAVRTPSRIDRDLREPSSGVTILSGGPNFRSETVVAYEAGYRAQIGTGIVGSVSIFYNDYRNIRSLTSTPVTVIPLYLANDLEGETHGLELTSSWDVLQWWQLRAGYTLLKSDIHVRPGGTDLNNGLNENSDPENQVALGSFMDLPGGIEWDTQVQWVDTLINNNGGTPSTVPSYFELNARFAIHLSKSVVLSVVGQNLLDDQHPEFGVPSVNRIEIRRSVYAKVTWRY
jgi:iron complex outermembrane receptor protein